MCSTDPEPEPHLATRALRIANVYRTLAKYHEVSPDFYTNGLIGSHRTGGSRSRHLLYFMKEETHTPSVHTKAMVGAGEPASALGQVQLEPDTRAERAVTQSDPTRRPPVGLRPPGDTTVPHTAQPRKVPNWNWSKGPAIRSL